MKESISFTIPLEVGALNRTAEMLQGMASDLAAKPCGDCNKETTTPPAPPETPAATNTTLDGAANMGSETTTPPAPPETPAATNTPPLGVDLDSDGLPWDGRIHGSAKKKLAKDQTWKKIRNVDPALVEQVEAELRAAMAAATPPAETTPPAPPETPAIVETTTPAAETTPPAPPATPATEITFPVFMSKVTNAMALGTLTDVMILAAVNKHGLASLPLLSARPDIIPAVDAELFPNG